MISLAFIALLALLFLAGYIHGQKSGRSTGYEEGWTDCELNDWRKDLPRRNRDGKFTSNRRLAL